MSLKRKHRDINEGLVEDERPAINGMHDAQLERETLPLSGDHAPETPSKKRRGRPPGSATKSKTTPNSARHQAIPRSAQKGKKLFETPTKTNSDVATDPIIRNPDRSARRKSARTLVERTVTAADQDGEAEEEDSLAKRIWAADEADEDDIHEDSDDEPIADPTTPVTPSKRGRKGPRRKRTPTPPPNLPPHEQYFFQNRPGNTKTSNNTFSSLSLLSHEQYHEQINSYRDPHTSSYAFLHSLHSRSFPQWRFELSQSFNICLYGYGSKRRLTSSFASYLHSQNPSTSPPKIIITNGYISTLTIRQMLTTIATVIYDCPNAS
ncbi:MAG: hypothetical protein Q9216_003244, partial [Gyalolechia sp. 2 TL-2023]